MKERMIELIKQAKKQTKNANCDIERNMIFADHLLENCVVVMPCNIGDDLYWIDDENNMVRNHKNGVEEIIYCGNGIWKIKDTDGNVDEVGTQYAYLSKEEAEKALKEGEGK